jgi:benzoate 4-monooxygenase
LPFWEVVQEAIVFLSAGSDTTASAMTNTLYLLIKHPDVLKKVQEKLVSVMPPSEAEESLTASHAQSPCIEWSVPSNTFGPVSIKDSGISLL